MVYEMLRHWDCLVAVGCLSVFIYIGAELTSQVLRRLGLGIGRAMSRKNLIAPVWTALRGDSRVIQETPAASLSSCSIEYLSLARF